MKSLYMIRILKQILCIKKIVLLTIVCSVSAFFVGCSGTHDRVESLAKEHAELLEKGKIEDINQIIFGMSELQTEAEVGTVEKGILSTIFSHSTVIVKKVTKDAVKLEISAPDMSELFLYLNKAAIYNTELTEYVDTYVNKAKMRDSSVSVAYTVEGDEVIIDYCKEEFIDAITGGLFGAYKKAYIDKMEKYRSEIKKW